ncbi:MAG: 3-hydroxyacyl-CoA dehydrogenase/enoyl-CoA hydratase family protein [Pyrinomonadaceae bacterium]
MTFVKKAAVLGAGTMGAQIAAHLANAGIPTLLLDVSPRDLTEEEKAQGLTIESPKVRNRVVHAGFNAALKAKPAAFFVRDKSSLVRTGNFADDLPLIKDCDLVIEAVVENLEIKRALYTQVEKHRRPGSVFASNTSGIPIHQLSEGRSEDFRKNFLGVHFFNPPRYLHLVEVIPTPETDPGVVAQIREFLDVRLGKGVVIANDRPNFVANRLGVHSGMITFRTAVEDGFTPEEVDKLTGPAIGRPRTGSFRLHDLVGIDVMVLVTENLYHAVPEDEEREQFQVPEPIKEMLRRGLSGDKKGSGFYRKVKGGTGSNNKQILTLDLNTLEYRETQKPNLPAVDAAMSIESVPERIRTLVWDKTRAGSFLWKTISRSLIYAGNRLGEIADSIVDIDRAIKWGYGWELGVFETWDAIGLASSVERMQQDGVKIPAKISEMLDLGAASFYKKENGRDLYFDFVSKSYKPVENLPGVIVLTSLKEREKVIRKNSGASLIDIGDGVACLEFHSKMNAIGGDIIEMLEFSLAEVAKNFVGLVVGNQGKNFSVGANLMLLLLEAQAENWEEIDGMIRIFQNATMSLRYSSKPVVVAPFQMALGGGCEVMLHADRVRASAETYAGLVEVGVGLIPAGGGTKEMLLRAIDHVPAGAKEIDPFPFVKNAFETIALAKVSTSAEEARGLGFLKNEDRISMNADRLIADAKKDCLALSTAGYVAPDRRSDIPALGLSALSAFRVGIHQMKRGKMISDHDALIGEKLARVLTGGDLNHMTLVSEEYFLDLEREVFLSLCGEQKTQERIAHTLKTGKPLRN